MTQGKAGPGPSGFFMSEFMGRMKRVVKGGCRHPGPFAQGAVTNGCRREKLDAGYQEIAQIIVDMQDDRRINA